MLLWGSVLLGKGEGAGGVWQPWEARGSPCTGMAALGTAGALLSTAGCLLTATRTWPGRCAGCLLGTLCTAQVPGFLEEELPGALLAPTASLHSQREPRQNPAPALSMLQEPTATQPVTRPRARSRSRRSRCRLFRGKFFCPPTCSAEIHQP